MLKDSIFAFQLNQITFYSLFREISLGDSFLFIPLRYKYLAYKQRTQGSIKKIKLCKV